MTRRAKRILEMIGLGLLWFWDPNHPRFEPMPHSPAPLTKTRQPRREAPVSILYGRMPVTWVTLEPEGADARDVVLFMN